MCVCGCVCGCVCVCVCLCWVFEKVTSVPAPKLACSMYPPPHCNTTTSVPAPKLACSPGSPEHEAAIDVTPW